VNRTGLNPTFPTQLKMSQQDIKPNLGADGNTMSAGPTSGSSAAGVGAPMPPPPPPPPSTGASGSGKKERERTSYRCDYCLCDITNVLHIKCATCPDFDLCLECFAAGKAVTPHEPNHPYRIMQQITVPIFTPDWGADEELLLLEAIKMYGLGNWQEAANHVGSKTKQQVEQHYMKVYLESPTAPLPDLSAPFPVVDASGDAAAGAGQADGSLTLAHTQSSSSSGHGSHGSSSSRRNRSSAASGAGSKADSLHAPGLCSAAVDAIHATTGAPGSATSSSSGSSANPKFGALAPPKNSLASLVGYSHHRGDFDVEYDNDAEVSVADMEFKQEDTPWERALKLKVLEIYNRRLDARQERKDFIVSRGLLYKKDRKRTREEKEVYNNMRVFARFHSEEEHEALVQGLLNERRLRQRIEQLQIYRAHGIKSLAEAAAFDVDHARREQANTNALIASTESRRGAGAGVASGAASLFQNEDRLSNRSRHLANQIAKMGGAGPAAADAINKAATSIMSAGTTTKRVKLTHDENGGDSTESKSDTAGESSASTGASAGAQAVFDVSAMEGVELLSAAERQLCSELRLIPQHYLTIKERIVRECVAHGFLVPNQARQLIRVDINATDRLVDFFVSVGWVNPIPPVAHNAPPLPEPAVRPPTTGPVNTLYPPKPYVQYG